MRCLTKCLQRSILTVLLILFVNPSQGEDAKRKKPIVPKGGVIRLFNGKDLTGLTTWLKDTKHKDPRKVFTMSDGMLHISGDGYGYVRTNSDYKDYHLIMEFNWGKRTWGGRKDRTKDSGCLVHCVGPDGSAGGTWMTSIEAQIIQGGVGDFILVGGNGDDGKRVPVALTCEVTKDRDGETVWKKGGAPKKFSGGRINWFGRDPDWKDVLGFRGKHDVESPDGKWTRMDVICDGGHIAIKVNGVLVNEGIAAFPSSGKILVQTEGAEMLVRRWELWPLGKAPKYKAEKK